MAILPFLTALALIQQPAPASAQGFSRTFASGQVFGQKTRHVTLRFENASLKDVLKRLQQEKIDFAVETDAFKDRKVTLNLNDVSLSTALDAIAEALGAHWESVGSVQVLKKGAGLRTGGLYQEGFRSLTTPGFEFRTFDPLGQGEAMKALLDAQKELAKAQGMNEEQRKDALKALEEARKDLAGRKFGSGFMIPKESYQYKSLSPKENEEFRKAMERIRGANPSIRTDRKAFESMQKEFAKNRIEFRGLSEEARKSLAKTRDSIAFSKVNFDSLLKSLTSEQKELSKKQGYLKLSDLTEEQRKLIGIKGDGKTEITIVRDGETVKIKGG